MNIRVNESERFGGAILRGSEWSSIELARETGLTDGISLLGRVELDSSDQIVAREFSDACEVEMGKASMPEGFIQRESRSSRDLSRLHSRNHCASEVGSVRGLDLSTEEVLAIALKVHAVRIDVYNETALTS